MHIQKLGWLAAAAMAGLMVGSGFQNKTDKIGVVDVGSIFQTSDLTNKKKDELRVMNDARTGVLQFIHTYRSFTPAQADRFKVLSLKPTLTGAEKTELDKIKADVMAQDKANKALQQKPNPTPDEVNKLNAISSQTQQSQAIEQSWVREFDTDLHDKQESLRQDVLDQVQGVVDDIGKKQGYTLIFVKDVAPYGANDVTAETLKVMNAKK